MENISGIINYMLAVGLLWTVMMALLMWRRRKLEKHRDECEMLYKNAIVKQIEDK